VLGINAEPVTIERIEYEIAERAWREGWVVPLVPGSITTATRSRPPGEPGSDGAAGSNGAAGDASGNGQAIRGSGAQDARPSSRPTGKAVAIVGSGPAGLAAAQQLRRAGHRVVVFERAERPGGLLRYGIPEFKMEKRVLDRRLGQLVAEGVEFRCGVQVGIAPAGLDREGRLEPGEERGLGTACAPSVASLRARDLLDEFDAVVLAGGATLPRDLDVPGRQLQGVCFAMQYLKPANLVQEGVLERSPIDAAGKRVVIIGGGDTGADCLGTAHRQGARSVHQLEILPRPPDERPPDNPWPTWPMIFRSSAAHEEGGERLYSVTAAAFIDDGTGRVAGVRLRKVRQELVDGRATFVPTGGPDVELPCELVVLAMGFLGPERRGVVAELGLELAANGTVAIGPDWQTSVPGVFACGDMARGQSLIVWAIAEGRSCAAAVDAWLMGDTALPAPLVPGQMAIR
jgi:glutamate synthase (NADPH/NADH) small chain